MALTSNCNLETGVYSENERVQNGAGCVTVKLNNAKLETNFPGAVWLWVGVRLRTRVWGTIMVRTSYISWVFVLFGSRFNPTHFKLSWSPFLHTLVSNGFSDQYIHSLNLYANRISD